VLMDWGKLPYLVRAGRAEVDLKLEGLSSASVWGLDTSGRRVDRISAHASGGTLQIPLDVNDRGSARILYEVIVGRSR